MINYCILLYDHILQGFDNFSLHQINSGQALAEPMYF